MHSAYGTLTPYGHPFQNVRLYISLVTSRQVRNPVQSDPTTPLLQRFRAYITKVWALPRSLAATQGITLVFSS
jgi:hypothetical protein